MKKETPIVKEVADKGKGSKSSSSKKPVAKEAPQVEKKVQEVKKVET